MVETNHPALDEALNLDRAEIGRLIEERLWAVYKQNW